MTESTLYFILGMAVALLLGLIAAPFLLRRTEARIRRRVEASMPMSLAEIEAGKDALRSEFATSHRRMELSSDAAREKSGAQLLEISRMREVASRLKATLAETESRLAEGRTREDDLRAELQSRTDQVSDLASRLVQAEKASTALNSQLADLRKRHEEISFTASQRQIEIMALSEAVTSKTRELAAVNARIAVAEANLQAERDQLKTERKDADTDRQKLVEHERRIERMYSDIADRDDRLDRRERETAGLQERIAKSLSVERDLDAKVARAAEEKSRLEAKVTDLTRQIEKLLNGVKGGDVENAMARLNVDRKRMEIQLSQMLSENASLKAELAKRSDGEAAPVPMVLLDQTTELRQHIQDLAAQVIRLATLAEGPEGPVATALSQPSAQPGGSVVSLADRVRQLQAIDEQKRRSAEI